MTLLRNVNVAFQDSLYISEFAELRTASPGNRSDVEFLYDKQPLLFDDISSGTGSAVHQTNGRDLLLSVGGSATGATGGVRQHYWTPYTPGSGQEIDMTGTLDGAALGGGTAYCFIRSTVTGSTILTQTPQASWSAATSGVDWSKSQIFRMSFQSLKVGRIQFSLVRNGLPVKVFEILNDNVRSTGYWQYANLPTYFKVYNDGTDTVSEFGYGDELNGIGFRYVFNGTQATATARAICETVKSQGGDKLFDMPGFPFDADRYTTAKTISNSLIPVLSIRVAATFNGIANRELVIPETYSIQTDNSIHYRIFYRPTLTNASFAALDSTYSGIEIDTAATALTGGYKIDSDYLTSGVRNQAIPKTGSLGRIIMSLGSLATSDILTIAAIRTSSNDAAVYAAIKGKEVR